MTATRRIAYVLPLFLLCALALIAVLRLWQTDGVGAEPVLTVYSGRSESLIQPLIAPFEQRTGIRVRIRYGQTAEMAATILEEGRHSPADVFFAQDAGALGALARSGRLQQLPDALLAPVEPRFRSPDDRWVGVSGRARVLVYHPDRVDEASLPDDLSGLCDPVWRGRVGWAPANGSFQAFVTALRVTEGEQAARDWLRCMQANDTRAYAKNTPIVWAVASGEIAVGLVNHYYLHALEQEHRTELGIRNHYPAGGVLVNAAGVGIVDTTRQPELAAQFIAYLLSDEAQRYFTDTLFEYPLATGVAANPALPPLQALVTPDLDLGALDDLETTLDLLHATGLL